jgi:hypothetical protein
MAILAHFEISSNADTSFERSFARFGRTWPCGFRPSLSHRSYCRCAAQAAPRYCRLQPPRATPPRFPAFWSTRRSTWPGHSSRSRTRFPAAPCPLGHRQPRHRRGRQSGSLRMPPVAVAPVVAQQASGQPTPPGSDAPRPLGQRRRERAETSATTKPTSSARRPDGQPVGEPLNCRGIAAAWR